MSDEGMSDEMLAVVRKDISSSGDFGEVAAHVAAALITRLAAAERERDALRDALQGMVRGCDYSHFSDAQLAAEAERYPSDWIDLITDARAALAATDAREAVAQWCSGCHEVRSVDCYRAGCPKSDTERRAAEILAAEARGAERERARKGHVTTYKRGFGPGDGDSAIEHGEVK